MARLDKSFSIFRPRLHAAVPSLLGLSLSHLSSGPDRILRTPLSKTSCHEISTQLGQSGVLEQLRGQEPLQIQVNPPNGESGSVFPQALDEFHNPSHACVDIVSIHGLTACLSVPVVVNTAAVTVAVKIPKRSTCRFTLGHV